MEEVTTQKVKLDHKSVTLFVRREDLIHPFISGNKFRKLKYNLIQAQLEGKSKLITFGGAFSNHIAAAAYAGKKYGFETIGVIRGEELHSKIAENPTLSFAQQCGMKFLFVTREEYQNKTSQDFLSKYKLYFKDSYCLPEGGTNELAVQGCEEILTPQDSDFDYICCAVGTGGTISGLINSAFSNQNILGFPALKGDFLADEISKMTQRKNWQLITDYHFGGYGKTTIDLIEFINLFYKNNSIPLDPIYTGKMMFGVFDLIDKGFFPVDSKILVIHTGGLQGVEGMNNKLKNKKLPIICFQ